MSFLQTMFTLEFRILNKVVVACNPVEGVSALWSSSNMTQFQILFFVIL